MKNIHGLVVRFSWDICAYVFIYKTNVTKFDSGNRKFELTIT